MPCSRMAGRPQLCRGREAPGPLPGAALPRGRLHVVGHHRSQRSLLGQLCPSEAPLADVPCYRPATAPGPQILWTIRLGLGPARSWSGAAMPGRPGDISQSRQGNGHEAPHSQGALPASPVIGEKGHQGAASFGAWSCCPGSWGLPEAACTLCPAPHAQCLGGRCSCCGGPASSAPAGTAARAAGKINFRGFHTGHLCP